MSGSTGLLEDTYRRQYFNSPKINNDNSFISLETLTNDTSPKFSSNERNANVRNDERKRELRINNFDNLYEDENKFSDKSSTLYKNSNDFDTFLPCIESVVTDSDFSDLAQEFAEFGKSFSKDSISFEKDYLFQNKKSNKKEFSKKFKVEVDPKTKYTYNNLYNINTEIYNSPSPTSLNRDVVEKEIKKYDNDVDRLDLRFIQNALLFQNKKDKREIYNPNENVLKALYETPNDKRLTKSFLDIDSDVNSFSNNKRLSSINKVDKDIEINEDDILLNSKNKVSYQNNCQNVRPIYLTNHQPVQPIQFYNKNYQKKSSTLPSKPSPLIESNNEYSDEIDIKSKNKTNMYGYDDDYTTDKYENSSRKIPPNNEYSISNSISSDDIPLANIKPSSTPTLSTISLSVPGDKSKCSSNDKSKKLNKPLIDLSTETTTIDYLKPAFTNSASNEKKEEKLSKKETKKKKKQLFSYCCSSKVLDNSFVEDGSKNYKKNLFIKCQKEQIHSFEAKRMNSSRNKSNTTSNISSLILSSSSKNDSIENNKENNRVSFKPNYLSRRSDSSSDCLSGVSSISTSSSCSINKSPTSPSSTFKNIIIDNSSMKEIKNLVNSDINNKSPPKSIIIPTNQTNTQYIQSKKENIFDERSSQISNNSIDTSSKSPNINSTESGCPIPEKKQVKYCTSYELCDDGNWKLVERRYNDSKVIKVEIISSKMI
ncbi:hypothetical protein BCR36DRAFT_579403 [Piromyces finnis]|uniref:Uncharacterized protein n=1 Tax=Piromyces finnis TaxID=1754191 RepID=A0A1Y1VMW9_9FUNG|nr:hypothetical protein BCR36DRAFT_579403 [Piromyces finnis]|eukprot:ORX59951.1 hypothetical protein BCR36DRAFT_579403 [Piromyces finnis]